VKAGQTLARRYVLVSEEAALANGVVRWGAQDTRLDRAVTLLTFPKKLAEQALAAANTARIARDGRLVRVTDVFRHKDDGPAVVVIDRPAGVRLAEVTAERFIPLDIARTIARATAEALDTASALGLESPGDLLEITVASTGKVVVAGAGLGAVHGDAPSAGAVVALWLRDTIAVDGILPEEVTSDERTLIKDAAAGKDVAIASVLERVERAEASLRGFKTATLRYDRLVPLPLPVLAEDDVDAAPAGDVVTAGPDTALGDTDLDALDESLWDLEDELDRDSEQVPSLTEAFFDFLHRRFPDSPWIARAAERAHAHTLAGPRFNPAPWMILALLGFLSVMGYLAWAWTIAPYDPDVDLYINPQQTWPAFTFDPSLPPPEPKG
jgi:hypothetical protein